MRRTSALCLLALLSVLATASRVHAQAVLNSNQISGHLAFTNQNPEILNIFDRNGLDQGLVEAGNIVAKISVGFAVPPLPQGCPWSGWMLPNLKWCEENLCAWVTAPANTWSNLAYIALGLLMWREARRMGSAPLRIFGPASIVVGVFSLVYHASYTFFFQFFDFIGMFVFCFVLIVLNWRRLGRLRDSQIVPAFLVGVGVCSASVPLL